MLVAMQQKWLNPQTLVLIDSGAKSSQEELVPTLAKPVPEQVMLKEGGVHPTWQITNGRGKLAWAFNYLLVGAEIGRAHV